MPGLEKVLKAVASKRRLAILRILHGSLEANVHSLARGVRLSIRSTSRHLRVLAAADIVETDQRGLSVYYRLAEPQHPAVVTVLTLV